MFSNCGAGEDSWDSLGNQGDLPVNPKGNQPWIFIERIDAEALALIVWPPDGKSWLIGKDPDARKDWEQEEKGETEDKIVGWHHQLDGNEFEQTPEDREGQGSLMCCSPWGHGVRHNWATEQQVSSECYLITYIHMYVWVAQLCLTFSYPMDCDLPDSSVHGIFQARYWSGLPFPIPE